MPGSEARLFVHSLIEAGRLDEDVLFEIVENIDMMRFWEGVGPMLRRREDGWNWQGLGNAIERRLEQEENAVLGFGFHIAEMPSVAGRQAIAPSFFRLLRRHPRLIQHSANEAMTRIHQVDPEGNFLGELRWFLETTGHPDLVVQGMRTMRSVGLNRLSLQARAMYVDVLCQMAPGMIGQTVLYVAPDEVWRHVERATWAKVMSVVDPALRPALLANVPRESLTRGAVGDTTIQSPG